MSKVQQLIAKLCPEGVEYKPLKDVCDFEDNKRKAVKASLRTPGDIPYYGANRIQDYVEGYTHNGEYVLLAEDGSPSANPYSIQWVSGKFWANNHVHVAKCKNGLVNRFLFHYLGTVNFTPYLSGGDRLKLTSAMLKQIPIPIPPIPVQEEIVKLLDKFTTITDELTETLQKGIELSQKQYKYYRDLLFSETKLSKDGFEWKTLDKVGELIRGNGLTKSDFTDVGVPAIHYGQIYTYYGTSTTKTKSFVSTELATKLKKVEAGDVVITNTSENVKDVGKSLLYLGEKTAVTGGHATIFKPDKSLIAGKYFVYYTQSIQFSKEKQKYARGTKVIDVSAKDMAKIVIPIPSLKIQNEIVAILDNLESVNKKLTAKLQKGIELSQKQYEYYRNQLLTFEPIKE